MEIFKDISVELMDHCGSDLSVVNAARVSFDKFSEFDEEGNLKKGDVGLINFLAKHKHKSPFNHTFVTFRVHAPIFVARQLVKHEYMPWNEVSRRYVTSDPDFHSFTWRFKPEENIKQGSGGEITDPELLEKLDNMYIDLVHHSLDVYTDMLNMGVSAEQARGCLLLSSNTTWWWSGTLFAFAKMASLRLDAHTQKESQYVAQLIDSAIEPLFPISWKAIKEHGV